MGSRGKYRSRLQIIADILQIVKDGSKKTRIMFQANLSYKLLKRYLNTVLGANLACLNDSSEYVITDKGKVFLEKFNEYSKRIDHVANDRMILESMCLVSSHFNPSRGVLQSVSE